MRDHDPTLAYIFLMTMLRFDISDEKAEALKEAADRMGLSIEELLRATVEDALHRLESDFETAAEKVLQKNAELYRRLA